MYFQSKFRAGSAAAQRFREPPCRFVENRNGWPGAACSRVKFLERHQATFPNVSHHFSQTCCWIVLIHQYEPTNDRVKRPLEVHCSWIAYFETNVANVASNSSCSSSLHCGRRPIYAQHVPVRAN